MSQAAPPRTPTATRADRPRREGILLVDKPAGCTSHDVVARARRALAVKRIGHAGTLDPPATGLLVLLVGRATRMAPYIDGEPKLYEAVIQFGQETSTDDATGEVTCTAPLPRGDAVARGIEALTGHIEQMPPSVSAKQVGGVRAHAAVRRGKPLELKAVRVTVHSWEVLELTAGMLVTRVSCSGGTFVRALARDLGRLAGSAAHLLRLRRLRSGPFDVAGATALNAIGADTRLLPLLAGMRSLHVERVTDDDARALRHGRTVAAATEGSRAALLNPEGALIAVAVREGDHWRPKVVLLDD